MRNKGFTLIELMIVVVIIGILAAIAIPNFMRMRDRAREASTEANMHTVQLNAEEFSTMANGAYPATLSTRVLDVLGEMSFVSNNSSSMAGSAAAPPYGDGHMIPESMKNPFLPTQYAIELGDAVSECGHVYFYGWGGVGSHDERYYSIRGGDRDGDPLLLLLTSGQ